MSSSSASLRTPAAGRSRLSLVVREVLGHERLLAFSIAVLAAVICFEPRIKGGGLTADDWPDFVAVKFPHAAGFDSTLAALQSAAGSRVGHMFYWLVSYTVFGEHTRLYSALIAGLAVLMAFALYLLLRELRFTVVQSLAIMLLSIVAPAAETVRMWFTIGGVQIALTLYFVGLMIAMKAFATDGKASKRLQLISYSLYVASAIYVETALPLIAISVLVYLTRAPVKAALWRWAADLVIVVAGYAATLAFVSSHNGFGKLPASQWGEHIHLLADQTYTVVARALGPLSTSDRAFAALGVVALAGACVALWRRGSLSDPARRELYRWSATFGISTAAIVVSYGVYVPAMLYYEPLGPGLATHINSVIAAPLAAGVVAIVMLAKLVATELLRGMPRRVLLCVPIVAVAWYATIAVEGIAGVRSDAHIWAYASERGGHVLNVLRRRLPDPLPSSTIYTFGEAGTVAPGMPIFYTSWEQTNAVKIAYNRADVSSFPVVAEGIQIDCAPNGVIPTVAGAPVESASPYRRSYFFDVPSGRTVLITSQRACARALGAFHAGPYVTSPPHEWWQ